MKAVMITGTTGFIGSHVAEELAERRIRMQLFTRRRTDFINLMEKKGAQIHLGEMDDIETIKNSVNGVDTIIHCAGATKAINKKGYLISNLQFTRNILNALKKGQRFIYISSQAAAGPSHGFPKTENDPSKPLTHYGTSKLLAEETVREWGRAHSQDYVIIRPSVVYGPREKALYHYFRSINRGFLFLPGNGKILLSIIHIKDLVSAILMTAESRSGGETYFACGDTPHTWKDIGHSIQRAFNKKRLLKIKIPAWLIYPFAYSAQTLSLVTRKPALIDSQKMVEIRQPEWLCSNKKIKDQLGWIPEMSLELGIKLTAEWYLQEEWI